MSDSIISRGIHEIQRMIHDHTYGVKYFMCAWPLTTTNTPGFT
jgi:hypothetical protein